VIFLLGTISTYYVLVYIRTGKEPKPTVGQSHVRETGSLRQEQIPRTPAAPEQEASGSAALGLSVVGGTLSSSSRASGARRASVDTVTILEQTILPVRLKETVRLTAGTVIEAEVAQDIRVNRQIAIPRGSLCYLRVEAEGAATPTRIPPSVVLYLDSLVVGERTYPVSANGMRVVASSPSSIVEPQLEAGMLISFRLNSPLVITGS